MRKSDDIPCRLLPVLSQITLTLTLTRAAALGFLSLLPLVSAAAADKATTGFVLLEPDQKLSYPLFGLLPIPLALEHQLAIAATVVLVTAASAFLLKTQDGADVLDLLSERILEPIESVQYLVTQLPTILWSQMVVFASSSVGLAGDLASRVSRFAPGSLGHGFGHDGAGPALPGLAGRAKKRPRKAALRRAVAKQGASVSKPTKALQQQHHPGLYNTGNTCFFNSVLQSLASSQNVAEYLDGVTALAERWDVATPVTDALRELLAALNAPSGKPSALYPTELSRALSQLSVMNGTRSLTGAHQQQDAHELLVLLTSAVDDEVQVIKAHRAEILRLSRGGMRAALPLAHIDEPASRHDPANVFRGLTAQRTSCYRCGYTEAIRHHAFDELSLNVPMYACTLEHCLARWEEVEEVEWVCHACSLRSTLEKLQGNCRRLEGPLHAVNGKKKGGEVMTASKKKRLKEARKAEARVRTVLEMGLHEDEALDSGLLDGIDLDRTPSASATKNVMLARPPHTLAIHLNRSTYYGSYGATKNNNAVHFSEMLDLRPFATGGTLSTSPDEPISEVPPLDGLLAAARGQPAEAQAQEGEQLLYRLQSIVVHLGGHHSGHYIAFRRRPPSSLAGGSSPSSFSSALNGIDLGFVPNGTAGGPAISKNDGWLRISDESVSACTLQDVLAQHAFLLFYERAAQPQPQQQSPTSPPPLQRSLAPNGHAAATSADAAAAAAAAAANGTALANWTADRRELRLRKLVQPLVVPRWSVEPPERERERGRWREPGLEA